MCIKSHGDKWANILWFKVLVQVIDNTGSTTFFLFDCIVAQSLGRSGQDLLDVVAEGDIAIPKS